MVQWPRGTRPGRPRRSWLTDNRGRSYRMGPTVAFQIYYQANEGKLWTRLYRNGEPLRVPALVTRDDFIEEVGNVPGAYQLQPLDADGKQCGDPPSMIFLPLPGTATAALPPTSPTADVTGGDDDVAHS